MNQDATAEMNHALLKKSAWPKESSTVEPSLQKTTTTPIMAVQETHSKRDTQTTNKIWKTQLNKAQRCQTSSGNWRTTQKKNPQSNGRSSTGAIRSRPVCQYVTCVWLKRPASYSNMKDRNRNPPTIQYSSTKDWRFTASAGIGASSLWVSATNFMKNKLRGKTCPKPKIFFYEIT